MKTKVIYMFLTTLVLVSCQQESGKIKEADFKYLMTNVSKGWSTQNTELALGSFDEDAIYMEPPNIQYYRGHKQLRTYFNALGVELKMKFHGLWFDESTQKGAAEYTFSYGQLMADTGVVVVEIENGKIIFWREYQRKGPSNFKEFIRTEEKDWQWHIGNYPISDDSLGLK